MKRGGGPLPRPPPETSFVHMGRGAFIYNKKKGDASQGWGPSPHPKLFFMVREGALRERKGPPTKAESSDLNYPFLPGGSGAVRASPDAPVLHPRVLSSLRLSGPVGGQH